MTGQLSPLAQGKAAGTTGYTSKLLKTGQTTQYNSELDDGYYEIGVAKSYTVNTAGAQSGTTNVDLATLVSDSGAFTSGDKTYTDAGKCGVFKAAGGETIVITGSASNNGTFTTASATANTVVFVEAIADEADAPATTFKKREAISNNTVLDNNTGLTWTRYNPVKLGAAGDGLIYRYGAINSAYRYCVEANAASLGGYTDWRVPNINELYSIADHEPTNSVPDATAFPNILAAYYWTSTIETSNTAKGLACNFANGIVIITANTAPYYCVLVRGGTA